MVESVDRLPGWTWVNLEETPDGETLTAPSRVRWSNGETPSATADFEVVDGRLVCIAVSLVGSAGIPVDMSKIRGLSLEQKGRDALASQAIRRRMASNQEEARRLDPSLPVVDVHHDWYFTQVEEVPDERDARRAADGVKSRRGRPPISEAELREVVRLYREHIDEQPIKAISIALGMPERTVSHRLKQAEKAGLLPQTTRGKTRKLN